MPCRESLNNKTPIMRERSEYVKSKSESSKVQLRTSSGEPLPGGGTSGRSASGGGGGSYSERTALGRAISVDGVGAVEGSVNGVAVVVARQVLYLQVWTTNESLWTYLEKNFLIQINNLASPYLQKALFLQFILVCVL